MKAEWIEGRYNSSTLDLGIVTLTVTWAMTGSGYVWSAGRLGDDTRRCKTMREAQSAAEAWARKALTLALGKLPEVDS